MLRPRNGGASVLGAAGMHEALETLSSSFTLRHHAWMQAIAVSQRAAVANLQREQCSIDGQPAQKIQRTCFGINCGACNAWDTQQELAGVSSCLDAGKCCVAESSVGVGAAAAELPLEQCCIDGRTAQKWRRICFGGK